MSNEVYGFARLPSPPDDAARICRDLESGTGLGVYQIPVNELYGFTEVPGPDDACFVFSVSDRPGNKNATYLVDYLDYADGAHIGMPLKGKERVRLLVRFVDLLFSEWRACSVSLAVTDSSQIEETKAVTPDDLFRTLVTDLEECAPPDVLYQIEGA